MPSRVRWLLVHEFLESMKKLQQKIESPCEVHDTTCYAKAFLIEVQQLVNWTLESPFRRTFRGCWIHPCSCRGQQSLIASSTVIAS